MEEGRDKPYFDGNGVVWLKDVVQFKAILPRRSGSAAMVDTAIEGSQKIMAVLAESPELTTQELADKIGVSRRAVAKHIAELQRCGELRRIGPDKGGHWEVVKTDNPL